MSFSLRNTALFRPVPPARLSGSRTTQRRRERVRLAVESLEERYSLAVFTVTTTTDTGPGSLRQAILDANDNPGQDRIDFAIDSGVQTITPKSPLPNISDPVTIDGTTQPGYKGAPIVELEGTQAGRVIAGLFLGQGSSGSTVRGLVINRFDPYGIADNITTQGHLIAGNYIGTDITGSRNLANRQGGVSLISSNSLIGGTTPADRNLISGNDGSGIAISGSRNVVQGNFLGTDVTGTKPLGNSAGVTIAKQTGPGGSSNLIGGTAPGAGNLISGNILYGVRFTGQPAPDNVVQGNLIGTDVTGAKPLGNGEYGVYIAAGLRNVIGGLEPGAGNLIAGNGLAGVWLSANQAWAVARNLVQGNLIVGNGGDGIFLGRFASLNRLEGNWIADNHGAGVRIGRDGLALGADNNRVGGTDEGEANAIFANEGPGVVVDRGNRNALRGNSVFDNAGLGIELLNGGNDDQEAPELSAAVAVGKTLFVDGALLSRPEGAFQLDFYASAGCDKSGFGEGELYLGFREVETDGDGLAVFAEEFTAEVPSGWVLTATATDPGGNTSAFSGCVDVREPGGAPGSGPSGFGDVLATLLVGAGRAAKRADGPTSP